MLWYVLNIYTYITIIWYICATILTQLYRHMSTNISYNIIIIFKCLNCKTYYYTYIILVYLVKYSKYI